MPLYSLLNVETKETASMYASDDEDAIEKFSAHVGRRLTLDERHSVSPYMMQAVIQTWSVGSRSDYDIGVFEILPED